MQTAAEVKAANPKLKTLLRHVNNTGYAWSLDWQANVNQAKAEYLTYIDGTFAQYAHLVDYVEEPRNEYVDDGMAGDTLAMRVMWARACAYVWATEFRPQWPHIMTLIGNVPVGNHVPLGFAQAAQEFGAGLAVHAYIHFIGLNQRDPQDFQYHSGRWNGDDALFRQHGIRVPIAITETGPYGSTDAGWRDPAILNGSIEGYVAAVRDWIRDVRGTVAYQEGRVIGFNLFTTIQSGWPYYQTNQPELNALAVMTKQEWIPPVGPPPPDPTPDPCLPRVPYQREYWAMPQDASPDQFAVLARLAHANKRTVGFSYDDAMFGPNLSGRKAVLFGIPANQQGSFTAFRDQYYPGTVVEFQPIPIVLGLPLLNGSITVGSRFNDPRPYGNGLHEGQDFPAVLGRNVYASYAGVVEFIGSGGNYGIYLRLRHEPAPGDIWKTYYCHLSEELVSVGQVVSKGELIGKVGSTGNSSGSHLHFNLVHVGYGLDGYVVDDVVDPLPYLGLS